MIHDRLLNYDIIAAEYLPSLAVRWYTDDYQTFRFYLREGVYFHNGDPFTAEDVVFTANLARDAIGSHANAQW